MSKTVITFGRMNPPTIGHQKVVDKVKAEAKKQGAMPHVYLSHSQDAKKNPLDYKTKVGIARKAFGPSVTRSDARTIIQVMQELEKMGHKEVTLIAGSDRVAEFKKLLNTYNGKDFTFDKITVKSAGQRDPDAEGAQGMSATKMRAAAQSGDFDSFKTGVPSALKGADIKKMYDKIRSVMEEIEVPDIDDDIEITEAELDAYIEMTDLESLDDYDLDEEFFDEQRKPLSISQRMAIGRRMKRLAPKMARMRKVKAKRLADKSTLEKRSRKAAINILRKKFAGKQGQNYASLNPGAKITVDKIIQKKMAMVGRISKKLLPKIRKKEMERLKRTRTSTNEMVEEAPNTADAIKRYKAGEAAKYEEVLWEDESEAMNTKMMSVIRQAFRNPQERLLVIRALKGGEKSLANPKLRPFLLKLLNRLLDVTREDPAMLAKMRDKLRRMGQDDEKMSQSEDPDIGDRKGSQPAKYHSGLAKSTKKKRDAQFKKQTKMDDDNPAAYKPAPGDKEAKTKPSKYTQRYKAMYGEDVNDLFERMFVKEEVLTEKQIEGLKKKSEKSGIPYGILKQVYNRGMAAWRTGHRPGTTPQQWAFARVNSFITGGKTRTTADKDLWAKASAARKSKQAEAYSFPRSRPGVKDFKKGTTKTKEALDKQDEPKVKEIIKKLKGASKAHAGQAKDLEKAVDEMKMYNINFGVIGDVSVKASSQTAAIKHAKKQMLRKNPKFKKDLEKFKVTVIKEGPAQDAVKARIEREKESDKRKHDRMMDTARTRDTQSKNRSESIDDQFESFFLEEPRVPRKAGQPAGSDKHSDENPMDEGLWDNIRKKRERIKRGSGERMRKPGEKGAPTSDQLRKAKSESVSEEGGAGEFGSKEVLQTYQKETPGQDCSCYDHELTEAEYKGRKVTLNDPMRSNDGKKKFYVYVKNEKGNVIKLGFGDPNMEIKRDDPGRRKNFRARHNCDNPGPKWKARYWSCYQWRAGSKVDN